MNFDVIKSSKSAELSLCCVGCCGFATVVRSMDLEIPAGFSLIFQTYRRVLSHISADSRLLNFIAAAQQAQACSGLVQLLNKKEEVSFN